LACPNYAVFDDNNESYYQEQVNANNEVGETMTEHDFTDTEYVEFEWLGNNNEKDRFCNITMIHRKVIITLNLHVYLL
jgi:hypothetical protein